MFARRIAIAGRSIDRLFRGARDFIRAVIGCLIKGRLNDAGAISRGMFIYSLNRDYVGKLRLKFDFKIFFKKKAHDVLYYLILEFREFYSIWNGEVIILVVHCLCDYLYSEIIVLVFYRIVLVFFSEIIVLVF